MINKPIERTLPNGTTIKYKFEIKVNRCVDDTIEKQSLPKRYSYNKNHI